MSFALCLLCPKGGINPPFRHKRACSSFDAAPQTRNDGNCFSGILYLMYKLSQKDCPKRNHAF